jgi:amidohydrolase
LQSAVISITQFQSGTALNIIPGQAVLGGTVRTYESAVREAVWQRMRSIITGVSSALGCRADIEIFESTPPVVNAEEITRVVQAAAGSIHPALSLLPNYQSSVSEDMAMFLEKIPGCYFFLGSAARSESERFGHHHPRFTFNEEALPLGAAILTQAAVNLLGTGGG